MAIYKHLLLALDFGDDQERLIDHAVSMASVFDARLTLAHIVDYMPAAYGGEVPLPDDLQMDALLLDKAKGRLASLVAGLALPDVDWRAELGVPKHGITRLAEELEVDLILVGSHGRHGLQLLLGSTANGVLHLAGCDVLAIRVKDGD